MMIRASRVHLAANELKEFSQRHLLFIHHIDKIFVKIMHERIRLNCVRLNTITHLSVSQVLNSQVM